MTDWTGFIIFVPILGSIVWLAWWTKEKEKRDTERQILNDIIYHKRSPAPCEAPNHTD